MASFQVRCPACKVLLSVSAENRDHIVHCGACGERFRLPDHIGFNDDDVADWLGNVVPPSEDVAITPEVQLEPAGDDFPTDSIAIEPAIVDGMRIVKAGSDAVLLEFPAELLENTPFRCAMPDKCLYCGSTAHLDIHVIIFVPRSWKGSFGKPYSGVAIAAKDAVELQGLDLLDSLPRIADVPHPGDLPMPYRLCDMCNGAGVVSGGIDVDEKTGQGSCRLLIRNTKRALEFVANAAGRDSPIFVTLRSQANRILERPWDSIPWLVLRRLRRWYELDEDEMPLAFSPDRTESRMHDGMAGIVVSSTRLIYHNQLHHNELPVSEPVEIIISTRQGRNHVQIKSALWQISRMPLDRDGIRSLRRSLTLGKFKVSWTETIDSRKSRGRSSRKEK